MFKCVVLISSTTSYLEHFQKNFVLTLLASLVCSELAHYEGGSDSQGKDSQWDCTLLDACSDLLGFEAIRLLHYQLDDDANGDVDVVETDEIEVFVEALNANLIIMVDSLITVGGTKSSDLFPILQDYVIYLSLLQRSDETDRMKVLKIRKDFEWKMPELVQEVKLAIKRGEAISGAEVLIPFKEPGLNSIWTSADLVKKYNRRFLEDLKHGFTANPASSLRNKMTDYKRQSSDYVKFYE